MTALTLTDLKKKSSKWQKIQKLWAEVEKKQDRNARFEQKIADYFKEFQEHAQAAEHQLCETRAQLIQHLLTFTKRKTIKGYRRETLYDWILQEIEVLNQNPFRTIDTGPLFDAYNEAIMAEDKSVDADPDLEIEIIQEAFKRFFDQDIPLSEEEILKFAKAPDDFRAFCQDFVDSNEYEHAEQKSNAEDENLAAVADSVFQGDKLGKLYRQLAKVLHPDKEPDLEKKQQKKMLMQELSQAKKDNDIFTLFTLAQTWLPDFEITLDKTTKAALEKALKQKIKTLNEAFDDLRHSSHKHSLIWMRFGENSLKATKANILAYADRITQRREDLTQMIAEFTTVKKMQNVLRNRDEQLRMYQKHSHTFHH